MAKKTHYRRFLPHINPLGGTYFVTFCLHETVTTPQIKKIAEAHHQRMAMLRAQPSVTAEVLDIEQRKYFKKFDEAILKHGNIHWLRDNHLAQLVANSMLFWDDKKIDLMAYCIMSNHVHMVLRLLDESEIGHEVALVEIMESVKKFSAKQGNLHLGRNGRFWQHESYDRLVRDRGELYRIICYVLDNPIKAGLCENRDEWKWNYVKECYNEFM